MENTPENSSHYFIRDGMEISQDSAKRLIKRGFVKAVGDGLFEGQTQSYEVIKSASL